MMLSSRLRAISRVQHALGELCAALGGLISEILWNDEPLHPHHPHPRLLRGGSWSLTLSPVLDARIAPGKVSVMYVVKSNQPDVPYVLAFQAVDAEGNKVPSTGVTVAVESDNPAAIAVTPDPGGDQMRGSIHIGGPGAEGEPAMANLTAVVKLADGTVVGSFGAQFTVTGGDPAAIVGGVMGFEGLSEVVAPPDPTAPARGRSRG